MNVIVGEHSVLPRSVDNAVGAFCGRTLCAPTVTHLQMIYKRRAEGSPPYEADLTTTVGRGALTPPCKRLAM